MQDANKYSSIRKKNIFNSFEISYPMMLKQLFCAYWILTYLHRSFQVYCNTSVISIAM